MSISSSPIALSSLRFRQHESHSMIYPVKEFLIDGKMQVLFLFRGTYNFPNKIADVGGLELWLCDLDVAAKFPDIQPDRNHPGIQFIDTFYGSVYSDERYKLMEEFARNSELTVEQAIEQLKQIYPLLDPDKIPRLQLGNVTPGAFFKGTKYRASSLCLGNKDRLDENGFPIVLTCTHVSKNGPDSFIIHTDLINEHTGHFAHHINHVTEIVSQPKRRHRMFSKEQHVRSPIGRYDGNPTHSVISSIKVANFLDRTLAMDQCVDWDAMSKELSKQSFFKFVEGTSYRVNHSLLDPDDQTGITLHNPAAPYKRIKRWIKQNVNRFLINPAKAQKDHDDMMNEIMSQLDDRDIEYGWPKLDEVQNIEEGDKVQLLDEEPPFQPEIDALGDAEVGIYPPEDDAASDERFALPA